MDIHLFSRIKIIEIYHVYGSNRGIIKRYVYTLFYQVIKIFKSKRTMNIFIM